MAVLQSLNIALEKEGKKKKKKVITTRGISSRSPSQVLPTANNQKEKKSLILHGWESSTGQKIRGI